MKIRRIACGAFATGLVAVLSAACGSESEGAGKDALDPGALDASGEGDGGPGSGNVDGGPGGSCGGTVTSSHKLVPINLAVMFDTSKSLVQDPDGDNTQTRWEPVKRAMKAFFADAQTAGMNASLHYFPIVDRGESRCVPAMYAEPVIARTALPSASFAASIDQRVPLGGSPMEPAMRGAVDAADRLAKARPGEKAVAVLVTDGGPNDCNSTYTSVLNVISKARAASPSISTVVVAVGPEAGNLNRLAEVGGTQKAIVVSPADPAKAAQDLRARVASLQGIPASCSLALSATEGRTVDRNAVTVTFTPGAGQPAALAYNPTCAGNTGWRFSDAAGPATVALCTASCNTLVGDTKASVSASFVCLPP
ncbi:VWA domain-containing protein [Pendulispora rubella]|uniref:VWA domain-containing protein n=1 Tax=Pendulispora rubella TaxID=2741070 RepID=A0ABZ2KVL3_9BACT